MNIIFKKNKTHHLFDQKRCCAIYYNIAEILILGLAIINTADTPDIIIIIIII